VSVSPARKDADMSNDLGFGQIVFDCVQADRVAGFWSALLDLPVRPGANRHFAVIERSEERGLPSLMFAAVPEPRQGKNRVHLDLTSADLDRAVERAVSLGASKVGDFNEYGTTWTSLTDPEGNVFDIGLRQLAAQE
jgi:predicted enzyme related to lactoylglutathione lyase